MSIGEWEPSRSRVIDLQKLKQYVGFAEQLDLDKLLEGLPAEIVKADMHLMKQPEAGWQAAEQLPDADLKALVRFFTLAEMQLPGWEGGKLSPVIYLVKVLRHRSAFDADLRRWIKANTDNRYLPNGAAL